MGEGKKPVTPLPASMSPTFFRAKKSTFSSWSFSAILKFTPRGAASDVEKVLKSAVANAENNFDLDRASLVVSEAFANEGPTLKRFRPRAKGSASPINKRTSHITVVVTER